MKSPFHSVALAAVGLVALVTSASALPIQWTTGTGANGHYYELVAETDTWATANTSATNRGGYLVTLTSANENLWVTNNILSAVGTGVNVWLGLFQQPGSVEPAGGWSWVTGEAFTYSNWNTGEPNNQGTENFAHFVGNAINAGGRRWNDISGTTGFSYYVVEYNTLQVPEVSSSLLLFGFGLSVLLGLRRRLA